MKKIILIVVVLLLSINTYPQFNKVIFQKSGHINSAAPNVYKLGDVNKDGYGDILIYDTYLKAAMIFLGGSSVDTIPKYTIQFSDSLFFVNAVTLDINSDGINDIIITTGIYRRDIGYHFAGDIRIFYGGNILDTVPNLIYNPPQGSSNNFGQMHLLKDFNGDGRNELVFFDPHIPYSTVNKFWGINYFYNTGAKFDTIPSYTIRGDSLKGIRIYAITSSGDINGDGKTDFTILCSDSTGGKYKYFTNFYLGNANFDLRPALTYYQDSVGFNLGQMKIVRDMNGDGKDDFLMKAYNNAYPYYYGNSILWGSFPIDTVQDVGLNTQNGLIENEYGAGDINGDGHNDLFVRMYGGFGYPNVKIWLGGKQMPYKIDDVADKTWYGDDYGLGRQIASVGDVDGDGVDDICIQIIPYGTYDDSVMSAIYIIKGDTSAKGDTVTAVSNDKNNLPTDYVLEDPSPNPFNPSTIISYRLSERGYVTLKVYDSLGGEITTLVNEEKPAGINKIEFDANKYKLSSSVYFIQMQVTVKNKIVFSQTKKLSLLK